MAQPKKNSGKYVVLVVVLFILPLLWILLFSKGAIHKFNTLPYYGPEGKFEPHVDSIVNPDDFYSIPTFSLTNHLGQAYGSDSLNGKTWLALFVSSDAPHIGQAVKPIATIHFDYREQEDINFVFFTNTPTTDTPEKLGKFIADVDKNEKYRFVPNKWQYLTGDSLAIAQLRERGFMIPSIEESAILWLVDAEGHLRGRYNPALEEQMKQAGEDIALLKKEIDQRAYEARKAAEE